MPSVFCVDVSLSLTLYSIEILFLSRTKRLQYLILFL